MEYQSTSSWSLPVTGNATKAIGKANKTIVKFANRNKTELFLRSNKKLKDINLLEVCSSTDGNWSLLYCETHSNSENVNVNKKNRGGKVYIYQSLCLDYRFLYSHVKERYNEGLFHDFFVTNEPYGLKNTNI